MASMIDYYLSRPGGWHGAGRPAPGPGVVTRAPGAPAARQGMSPTARAAMQKAISYYQPGGGFGAGMEARIERGRTKAVAGGMQQLVSSGLAGTTMPAGLETKFEEETAMPIRAGMESTRAQAIAGLYARQAGMEQAGFESAAGRNLQEYLARLQNVPRGGYAPVSKPATTSTRTPESIRDVGGYGPNYGVVPDEREVAFPAAGGGVMGGGEPYYFEAAPGWKTGPVYGAAYGRNAGGGGETLGEQIYPRGGLFESAVKRFTQPLR